MAMEMQRVAGARARSGDEVRDPGVSSRQCEDVVVGGKDGFVLVFH